MHTHIHTKEAHGIFDTCRYGLVGQFTFTVQNNGREKRQDVHNKADLNL